MKHFLLFTFYILLVFNLNANNTTMHLRSSINNQYSKQNFFPLLDTTIENETIIDIIKFLSKDPSYKQNLLLSKILSKPSVYEFKDSSIYWGELTDNIPNGFGIKFKKDDKITIGQFKNGLVNNLGFTYFSSGVIYFGEYKDGFRNGNGVLYNLRDTLSFEKNIIEILNGNCANLFKNNNLFNKYVGHFSNMNNIREKQTFDGTYIKYQSDIENKLLYDKPLFTISGKQIFGNVSGKAWGYYDFLDKDGSLLEKWVYNGNFINGKIGGEGLLYRIFLKYNVYVKYQGNFFGIDSLIGIMQTPDGTIYEGNINLKIEELNSSLNGKGKIINKVHFFPTEGDQNYIYEGDIKNCQPHGEGKKSYFNGDYMIGKFEMGSLISGEWYKAYNGIYEKIIGKFKNGLPDGNVKITTNGKTTQVNFTNGKRN